MVKVKIGIIGGSGLNNPELLKNGVEKTVETPFGSPSDVLIEGQVHDVDVVLLARHGRGHTINPTNVNYRANIFALKTLGCTHVIVSAAVGSLKEEIEPGTFVIPDSFIDRTTKRIQTFYDGSASGLPGVCHIPMEPAFCNRTRQILLESAQNLGLTVHPTGSLVVIEGPRFSSKAESNMFRMMGGSIIGMTLVPEVVLAKEAGLSYACVAMATDYDCWFDHVVDVPSVLATFKKNVESMLKIFLTAIPKIASEDWTDTLRDNEVSRIFPKVDGQEWNTVRASKEIMIARNSGPGKFYPIQLEYTSLRCAIEPRFKGPKLSPPPPQIIQAALYENSEQLTTSGNFFSCFATHKTERSENPESSEIR